MPVDDVAPSPHAAERKTCRVRPVGTPEKRDELVVRGRIEEDDVAGVPKICADETAPGAMSLTSDVPASDPSLRQSSSPAAAVNAVKKRPAAVWTSAEGFEPSGPGLTSFTSRVPPGVPSDAQSSNPWTPSSAAKKRVPFASVSRPGELLFAEATTGPSGFVPAAVPSER